MQTNIHPSAVVHPGAYLGTGVTVGPFAIIEDCVHIGDETIVDAGAQIKRFTTLGTKNHVHSMACVGGEPQDLKFGGEESKLVIGDRNRIREFSTIHRGTEGGGGVTMAAIVYQTNKKTGIIYAYESKSYWDKTNSSLGQSVFALDAWILRQKRSSQLGKGYLCH